MVRSILWAAFLVLFGCVCADQMDTASFPSQRAEGVSVYKRDAGCAWPRISFIQHILVYGL